VEVTFTNRQNLKSRQCSNVLEKVYWERSIIQMQFFKGARIEESPCEKGRRRDMKKIMVVQNSHVPLLLIKILRN
jgi:hypothetical protein